MENNTPSVQPSVTVTGVEQEIANKMQIWALVGQSVHNLNQTLSLRSQSAISRLKIPTSLSECAEAERIASEVKKEMEQISIERKSLTSKFDAVASKLMEYEKNIATELPKVSAASLALKKAEQLRIDAEKAEAQRKANLLAQFIGDLNQLYVNWKNTINDKCLKSFNWALDKDIAPEKIPGLLVALKEKMVESDYVLPTYTGTDTDIWQQALSKTDIPSAKDLNAYAHAQLDKQFEFYSAAFANKEAAKEQAAKKAEADRIENERLLSAKEVEAKLDAISEVIEPIIETEDTGKSIKRQYKVDLSGEDFTTIKAIMSAFILNYDKVSGGVRVKALSKLSIEQMAAALSWYKNQRDSAFECGVKFIEVEKL